MKKENSVKLEDNFCLMKWNLFGGWEWESQKKIHHLQIIRITMKVT